MKKGVLKILYVSIVEGIAEFYRRFGARHTPYYDVWRAGWKARALRALQCLVPGRARAAK